MTAQLSLLFPPAGERLLRLSRGRFAIVDERDFDRANAFKWSASNSRGGLCYVARQVRKADGTVTTIKLHRFILDAPPGHVVDHVNRDPLDNRRTNLRLCAQRDNTRNRRKSDGKTSRYKGVSWSRQKKRWRAVIRAGARRPNGYSGDIHLGHFATELDAALAYDAAALKHFGEFAAPNFPELAA